MRPCMYCLINVVLVSWKCYLSIYPCRLFLETVFSFMFYITKIKKLKQAQCNISQN